MATEDAAQYIVFYGTLMRGFPTLAHLGIEHMVSYQADCLMRGDLLDLGLYPGMIQGQGRARGELYRVDDPDALAILDKFEDYHPEDPDGSEYLRLAVDLLEPRQTAWAYVLNRPLKPGEALINSGCWKTHYRENKRGDSYWRDFLGGRPDVE